MRRESMHTCPCSFPVVITYPTASNGSICVMATAHEQENNVSMDREHERMNKQGKEHLHFLALFNVIHSSNLGVIQVNLY